MNAPDITLLDAARVIIAVVASTSPSRAARDVTYFGALKPDLRRGSDIDEMGLDPEKTLEEALVSFLQDGLPPSATFVGEGLRLSDCGQAALYFGGGWVEYHQRERWEAFMAERAASHGTSRKSPLADDTDDLLRSNAASKINRSADFSLVQILEIGVEMTGREVG
ncbi:hypothetical protein M2324_003061 [Rhodovulum sulfidophilum]|uniref:hypothetical protein n=1 Tax=Rhodovulum sulfidophilum TaxID=35806 RepID=UPI0005A742F6|nr:hypothetical protein [Rhodovulum sulfidophilum]MCW2304650.1 hypothetical protein [Rhodovulum sulfidophilum]